MLPNPFQTSPDLTRAETPPGRAYADPDSFHAVRERALARSWHWLDVPDPGPGPAPHVHPFDLCPGALDEPLVLTHSDATHLLSNVCTHRASPVCLHAGPERELRCPYHGRAFALDGRLLRAPGFEGAVDFPRPADDLPRLTLERLGPLLFSTLRPDAAPPFARWIAPARERFGWFPWDRLEREAGADHSYEVRAHWALYVENYLEGFHIPWVHPELRAALAPGDYRVEPLEHGCLQLGIAPPGEPALRAPEGSPEHGTALAGIYLWLFPNLMLNLYPWGLSLNRVVPLSAERTRIDYRRWVCEPGLLGRGAGGDLDLVERQDDAIVEGVARGVRARLYGRGRYAPRHEAGTHHFHRLLARTLEGP